MSAAFRASSGHSSAALSETAARPLAGPLRRPPLPNPPRNVAAGVQGAPRAGQMAQPFQSSFAKSASSGSLSSGEVSATSDGGTTTPSSSSRCRCGSAPACAVAAKMLLQHSGAGTSGFGRAHSSSSAATRAPSSASASSGACASTSESGQAMSSPASVVESSPSSQPCAPLPSAVGSDRGEDCQCSTHACMALRAFNAIVADRESQNNGHPAATRGKLARSRRPRGPRTAELVANDETSGAVRRRRIERPEWNSDTEVPSDFGAWGSSEQRQQQETVVHEPGPDWQPQQEPTAWEEEDKATKPTPLEMEVSSPLAEGMSGAQLDATPAGPVYMPIEDIHFSHDLQSEWFTRTGSKEPDHSVLATFLEMAEEQEDGHEEPLPCDDTLVPLEEGPRTGELRQKEEALRELQARRYEEEARLSNLEVELEERAKSLAGLERELTDREKGLRAREAAVAKMESILEMRSKNLGFNARRKCKEVEDRKRGIAQEALKEVSEIKRKQEEDFQRQQEEAEERRRAMEQEALKEIEEVKRRVEQDKRKVECEKAEAAKRKHDAMQLALGLKAPAPEHWINQKMDPKCNVQVPWRKGSDALQSLLLQAAVHPSCQGRDGKFEAAKVRRVRTWRVENPILWRQYCSKASELQERHEVSRTPCKPLEPAVPEYRAPGHEEIRSLRWWETFDRNVNEVMLWHGTRREIVDIIARDGFDERVCSLSGMFGAGLYFAQDSCKSGQYALRDTERSQWFLLCRVLLGKAFYAVDAMPSVRKAPDGFDSVVYNPGGGRGTATGHHREFIVYDRYQAYPEYIVQALT